MGNFQHSEDGRIGPHDDRKKLQLQRVQAMRRSLILNSDGYAKSSSRHEGNRISGQWAWTLPRDDDVGPTGIIEKLG